MPKASKTAFTLRRCRSPMSWRRLPTSTVSPPTSGLAEKESRPERVELVERREAVAIAVQARTGLLQNRLEVAEEGARQVWGLRHMQGAAGRPLSGCRPRARGRS